MFDKWKAKRELYKAFRMYCKKKKPYLKVETIELYMQLQNIEHTIAYILCEYFDFPYQYHYDNSFGYKFDIAYDYIKLYDECKKAYENFIKENNHIKNKAINCDYIIQNTEDLSFFKYTLTKGDVIYNMENKRTYMYDGKNFIEKC